MNNGPCAVGSVAFLKTTSTNNSKGRNIHRYYELDSQYAEVFLVDLPSGVHARMTNLVKFD